MLNGVEIIENVFQLLLELLDTISLESSKKRLFIQHAGLVREGVAGLPVLVVVW